MMMAPLAGTCSLTNFPEFMQIVGRWELGDDGVTRPVVRAQVSTAVGSLEPDEFLVDTGADRTVLSALLLDKLGLAVSAPPTGQALQGIGGVGDSVVVKTVVVLNRDDGGEVHMRGEFAAFTDPSTSDLSILGRDVLNHFDVIQSRRRQVPTCLRFA